ncbi:hypothetical protein OG935_06145 [Nocardia cyriacigeorgica]|uniref:hypothetical protein n=1 Tax=Nocardia cyriacigeorgica TaxID=135487 RepID=UPI002E1E5E20
MAKKDCAFAGGQIAAGSLILMIAIAPIAGCSKSDAPAAVKSSIYPTYVADDVNQDGKVTEEDYDLMPPSEYISLDDKVRVEDTAAPMNKYIPSAWDTIQNHLTPAEAAVMYLPNLTADRMTWSDQDYYNNYSLAIWLASTQGSTQEQIDEGKRTLSCVISPSHSSFSSTFDALGQIGPFRNIYQAQSDKFKGVNIKPGTVIDGIHFDESGGRLARGYYIDTGQISYDVFVNRTDSKGNVITILARSYTSLLVPELKGIR